MTKNVKNSELDSYLKTLLGDDYSNFLSAAQEPTSIRTNTLKATPADVERLLARIDYKYKKISFNPKGFILDSDHLPLSHTLAFFEGRFQYQGVSSQLPVIILDPQPGEQVLDMAAAPGSKSSQIAAMMAQEGELVLNDSSYSRLQGLQANMQRSGALTQVILKHRGENLSRIYPGYFDKILLDAPCTALGTYFSSSEKYSWWSDKKIEKLSHLQYQLMVSAIKCLKIGGELVYSTCSVAPEENELMIEKIIRKYPLEVVEIDPGLFSQFRGGMTFYNDKQINEELRLSLRIWPHVHNFEGFFVVKMKKTAGFDSEGEKNSFDYIKPKFADEPQIHDVLLELSSSWGIDEQIWKDYRFILTKTRIWMMGQAIEKIPSDNFVSAGLLLAEHRLNGWKLVNGSAQYLSDQITKRRISLSAEQLTMLFKEGRVRYEMLPEDYYVLEYDKRIIGSLYHERGTLRIRLPHLFTRFRI